MIFWIWTDPGRSWLWPIFFQCSRSLKNLEKFRVPLFFQCGHDRYARIKYWKNSDRPDCLEIYFSSFPEAETRDHRIAAVRWRRKLLSILQIISFKWQKEENNYWIERNFRQSRVIFSSLVRFCREAIFISRVNRKEIPVLPYRFIHRWN